MHFFNNKLQFLYYGFSLGLINILSGKQIETKVNKLNSYYVIRTNKHKDIYYTPDHYGKVFSSKK